MTSTRRRQAALHTDAGVPVLLERLGGRQGIVDGALPPLAFVVAHAAARVWQPSDTALWWATASALATGLTLLVSRLGRGQPLAPAARGLAGTAVAIGFAALSGDPRNFFLPGIYVDLAYAVAFSASALLGHPLVGHGYAFLFGLDRQWRHDRRLRRTFVVATFGWSGVWAIRAGAQAWLYRDDRTELLALAKLGLGWPLTAGAAALTLVAVRRARRATRRAGQPVDSGPTAPSRTVITRPTNRAGHDRRSTMYAHDRLADLGERIAEDGIAPHEREILDIAAAVAARAPGTAAVLRDASAAVVLRQRAFAVASDILVATPRRRACCQTAA